MEPLTCSRPYARAAFAYASEQGALDAWSALLTGCAAAAKDPGVAMRLKDPDLGADQKAGIFFQLCDEWLDDKSRNFIRVLSQGGRLGLLPFIATLFQAMKSEAESSVTADIVSAFPLSDSQVQALVSVLCQKTGKKIQAKPSVDADLVGGVVIRMADFVIDGSIKAKLARLADAISS